MSLARMAAGHAPAKPGAEGPLDNPGATRTGSLGKLPLMATGGASPWPRCASLDFPPPPSPMHAARHGKTMAPGVLGATSAVGAMAEREVQHPRPASRMFETRARAELWAVRADMHQEKLRTVAPYPFFGRAMRFQDNFAALQIADDGRFSYSTVSIESVEAPERAGSAGAQPAPAARGKGNREPTRRIVTYEGVLVEPHPVEAEEGAAAEAEDPAVACIEGHALVRHEMDEHQGRTQLVGVERGSFRLVITVTPYFQPEGATVQLLVKPSSPGRLPPRRRSLPYVGAGPSQCGGPSAAGPVLQHGRGRGHRLKFTRASTLVPGRGEHGSFARSLQATLPKLGASASAPALPSLSAPAPKEGGALPTVADWKEYYRQRAENLLRATGGN